MLEGSEFTPIFLQFGSQEHIGHPALIRLMADGLRAELEAVVDDRSFGKLNEWFSSEESSRVTEQSRDGSASIGGNYLIASAKGSVKQSKTTTVTQTTTTERGIRDLVNRFNDLVEKAETKGDTRLVFVVDDIDKVQDVESVNATFIHSSHIIGALECACIFTVPITYATSNFVRLAGLPYNGIYRVPAVDLFDQQGQRNHEAQQFMRDVFRLRMPYNPVPSDILDDVLDKSGGVLIDAMRMLRGICKKRIMDSSIEIGAKVVDEQFQQLVDDYQFVIDTQQLWQAVITIANSKSKGGMTDGLLPELLYKMIAIEYRRERAWFDLHPAVKRLYEQNPEVGA
jgi:hypothetical protein